MDGHRQLLGHRVDSADTDSVQASSDLVGLIVELAAGVEPSHYDLGSANALLRMLVYWDPPPVIDYGDGTILLEVHLDRGVVPS